MLFFSTFVLRCLLSLPSTPAWSYTAPVVGCSWLEYKGVIDNQMAMQEFELKKDLPLIRVKYISLDAQLTLTFPR